jgi:hypothetical protein
MDYNVSDLVVTLPGNEIPAGCPANLQPISIGMRLDF